VETSTSVNPFSVKLIVLSFAFIALLISCHDDSPSKSTPPPVTTPPPVVTPPPVTPPSTNPLDDLPKDMGGVHKPVVLGADNSPYGYYLYTPSGYSPNGPRFPLLVFLHGSGQIGNSQNDPTDLDSVLREGPPHLILQGDWKPKYPMIVASAQCHEGSWDPIKVKEFVEFIRASYQVDTLRIYLTGLSMGGSGTSRCMVPTHTLPQQFLFPAEVISQKKKREKPPRSPFGHSMAKTIKMFFPTFPKPL